MCLFISQCSPEVQESWLQNDKNMRAERHIVVGKSEFELTYLGCRPLSQVDVSDVKASSPMMSHEESRNVRTVKTRRNNVCSI